MDTCYGVRIHTTKTMREGERSWSVPSSNFYAGRKHGQLQTTVNHYAATPMTKSLAEQTHCEVEFIRRGASLSPLR